MDLITIVLATYFVCGTLCGFYGAVNKSAIVRIARRKLRCPKH